MYIILVLADKEEHVTIGLELVQETIEKIMAIRKRRKVVQSHYKNYADPKRHEVQFEIGDYVFLNVTPRHGILGFRCETQLLK